MLLGLLANYNRFEFQNPYRLRLGDFVNASVIEKIINAIGKTCSAARNEYVAVQDDLPEEWSVGSALAYLGLAKIGLGGKRVVARTVDDDTARALFGVL
jgi:hypothetical protein